MLTHHYGILASPRLLEGQHHEAEKRIEVSCVVFLGNLGERDHGPALLECQQTRKMKYGERSSTW